MAKRKVKVPLMPIVAMVMVAVICASTFLLLRNDDRDDIVIEKKGDTQKAIPPKEPRDTNMKRPRKLKDYEQRQKLIEAIEMARQIRTMKEKNQRSDEVLDSDEDKRRKRWETKMSIIEEIRTIEDDVYECYKNALEESPNLTGELTVLFEYEGEPGWGSVIKKAEVTEGSDKSLRSHANLTKCIINTYYMLEFPEPEEGRTATVSMSYVLTPNLVDKSARELQAL